MEIVRFATKNEISIFWPRWWVGLSFGPSRVREISTSPERRKGCWLGEQIWKTKVRSAMRMIFHFETNTSVDCFGVIFYRAVRWVCERRSEWSTRHLEEISKQCISKPWKEQHLIGGINIAEKRAMCNERPIQPYNNGGKKINSSSFAVGIKEISEFMRLQKMI